VERSTECLLEDLHHRLIRLRLQSLWDQEEEQEDNNHETRGDEHVDTAETQADEHIDTVESPVDVDLAGGKQVQTTATHSTDQSGNRRRTTADREVASTLTSPGDQQMLTRAQRMEQEARAERARLAERQHLERQIRKKARKADNSDADNLLGLGIGFTIDGYAKAILVGALYEGQSHPVYMPWVHKQVGIIPWSKQNVSHPTMGVMMRNSRGYEIHLFRKLGDGTFHLSADKACDWMNQDFVPTVKEMFNCCTGMEFVIGKVIKNLVWSQLLDNGHCTTQLQ
jgi:hypothetical protein